MLRDNDVPAKLKGHQRRCARSYYVPRKIIKTSSHHTVCLFLLLACIKKHPTIHVFIFAQVSVFLTPRESSADTGLHEHPRGHCIPPHSAILCIRSRGLSSGGPQAGYQVRFHIVIAIEIVFCSVSFAGVHRSPRWYKQIASKLDSRFASHPKGFVAGYTYRLTVGHIRNNRERKVLLRDKAQFDESRHAGGGLKCYR